MPVTIMRNLFFIVLLGCLLQFSQAIQLKAYLSEHGLHGVITYNQNNDRSITLITDLKATLEFPNQIWSWSIVQFPVDYSLIEGRCDNLGDEVKLLDDVFSYLVMPENATISKTTTDLSMTGPKGLYGKSLLLKNVETNSVTCTSLLISDKTVEKTAVAQFNSPIAGNVYFRWILTKNNQSDMLIQTDLYHVRDVEKHEKKVKDTTHHWKLFVTDILDSTNKGENNCNILQLVFNPYSKEEGQAMGDIDRRVGKVKISTDYTKQKYKSLFRDEELILLPSDLTGPQRRLYLVIFETKHEDSFLACAKIRYVHPINAKVIIQSGGIKGHISLTQHTKFEPTVLNFNLTTARGDIETRLVYSSSVSGYKIHELPVMPPKTVDQTENACITTKNVYNPKNTDVTLVPPNGFGTQDQYPLGDLTGKLFKRNNETDIIDGSVELKGIYWDIYLPLQGQHSIMHRSLVIYKNTQYQTHLISEPWICGSISPYDQNLQYQLPIATAEVLFRYPLVGRILFRQTKESPHEDTTVLIEYLAHADGSYINNTQSHRWAVHDQKVGKDFYNWTARCLSAGDIYNAYKVDWTNKTAPEDCTFSTIGICRLGDLSSRLGTLDIAGRIANSQKIARRMFSDPYLPLSGPHGILGKSLVLYDDHGPKARGERLACSQITGVYRRKAVVKDWFANGEELTVKGKIEFYQQTEYDITNVEVDIDGLIDNSGYHVHVTPVEAHLEFPCESSTLYDHWNPLSVDPQSSPRTYQGTPDQYEMGDLSGKHGTLDNHTLFKTDYNDTMLPIFGPRSILGRSIVIHKKMQNQRWACSTIERGYAPSEARELRAIASFHHPGGYAYGYIRMTQLIHFDDSKGETIIEVKLRHPGKNDRNMTREHNWAIYVNPVGVDAAVKVQDTRCVAGGYIWNPYYTQLADPLNHDLYNQECGPLNPLRCYVGDLSARLGTIDIGLRRRVFTDTNLPLEGDVTAIGRSIVIFGPNRDSLRFACANIEPDYDIIKYANIEKPPRFVLAQFIEDVQRVMGIPEWMLSVDSRKTRSLHHNACVQFLLHFKGPIAAKIEQDFSKLIATGKLESPSLSIPGYIDTKRKSSISYKQCGTRDPNEKEKKNFFKFFSSAASTYVNGYYNIFITLITCTVPYLRLF